MNNKVKVIVFKNMISFDIQNFENMNCKQVKYNKLAKIHGAEL